MASLRLGASQRLHWCPRCSTGSLWWLGQSSSLASTLNQSAFNLGDALGAALGAALLANGWGYLSLPWFSAAVVGLALFPALLSSRSFRLDADSHFLTPDSQTVDFATTSDVSSDPMKIATFNINNVNRRLANLLAWLQQARPDVVCLQELKASDAAFPAGGDPRRRLWRGLAGPADLERRGDPGPRTPIRC